MPNWLAETLKILGALSVWVFLGLTVALSVILFGPTPPGIVLEPIRLEWGGWMWVGLVVFGFLTLARLIQWITGRVGAGWRWLQTRAKSKADAEIQRQERAEYERTVLAHLDTLSSEEREALRYLVQHNQRTAEGSAIHGPLHTLNSKGLLEVRSAVDPLQTPHTVPDFVWNALLARRDELFG